MQSPVAAIVTRHETGSVPAIPSVFSQARLPVRVDKVVPNITPDPGTGIGKWSDDDIMTLLKDGQTPDFDFVGGGMAEIVKNTTRLTDADRRAIAVYLRTLPPVRSETRAAK